MESEERHADILAIALSTPNDTARSNLEHVSSTSACPSFPSPLAKRGISRNLRLKTQQAAFAAVSPLSLGRGAGGEGNAELSNSG